MSDYESTVVRGNDSVLATNSVIRNTYILLSLTLLFSAAMSGVAMITNAPPLHPFLVLAVYFGLLFLTQATRNNGFGIVSVFLFTGFLGFTLGPMLNAILGAYTNGAALIMTAFAGTGAIFIVLSVYALVTRKDFSYMAGFLFVGVTTAFLVGIAAMVFNIPALSLGVSAAFILLSSGYILFQTSAMINGGETNYIMATISLYVSLFNIFVSLLNILSALSGNRR